MYIQGSKNAECSKLCHCKVSYFTDFFVFGISKREKAVVVDILDTVLNIVKLSALQILHTFITVQNV